MSTRSGHAVPRPLIGALEDFRGRLEGRFGERVECLRLFGSWARGQAHADSDVDVLVVVRGLTKAERREVYELAYESYDAHAFDISPLALSSDEWRDRLAREIRLAHDIQEGGVPL